MCRYTRRGDPGCSRPRGEHSSALLLGVRSWGFPSCPAAPAGTPPQGPSFVPPSSLRPEPRGLNQGAAGGLLLRLNYAIVIFYKMPHKTYSWLGLRVIPASLVVEYILYEIA